MPPTPCPYLASAFHNSLLIFFLTLVVLLYMDPNHTFCNISPQEFKKRIFSDSQDTSALPTTELKKAPPPLSL